MDLVSTKGLWKELVRAVLGVLLTISLAHADTERVFVVLREHASGSAVRAQPFLDQLLGVVAKKNGWPVVSGRYFSERGPALDFIRTQEPQFGIFSLEAFLEFRGPHQLSVVGEVVAPRAGGLQYYLVSKQAKDLSACKNQRLTTTFSTSTRFVERVVARGAFKLGDFRVIEARRPLQPLKSVLRGEADCALIDDAQLDATRHIENGSQLKPIWQSAKLPGMAVVAFPKADAVSVSRFKASLPGLCPSAKEACTSVGIERLQPATDSNYRAVISAYSK